jgi:hypothetical protein
MRRGFRSIHDVVALPLLLLDAHRIGWPAAVGAAGAAIALLGLYLRAPATAEIGFAVLAGAVLRFIFNARRAVDATEPHQLLPHVAKACTAAIVILLAVCMMLGRSAQVPPQAYFTLASITAALIALQIVVAPLPQYRAVILVEIVLLALVLRAVLLFAYPSLYGTDTWAHAGAMDDWYDAGRLLREGVHGSSTYYSFPVTYLHTIAVRLVSAADVRMSMFVAITIPLAFTAFTAYCIGRILVGERAGLLGALGTSFNQFLVIWGAFTIPTVIGVVLFTALMLQIAKPHHGAMHWLVFLLLACALIWTHTISAFVAAIALFSFSIAGYVVSKGRHQASDAATSSLLVAAAFFVSLMLARWLYAYYPDQLFFERVLDPFWNALRVDTTFTGTPFEPAPSIWNRIAFLMTIVLASWGGVLWLQPSDRTRTRLAWLVAALVIAAVMFGFTFLGIRNLIPQRWLAFIFIMTTPVVGASLLSSMYGSRSLPWGTILVTLVVGAWAWFSVNTNFVNLATPFYESNVRYPYTTSEQAAVRHVLTIHAGTIIMDRTLYGDYPHYIAPGRIYAPIDSAESLFNSVAVIRKYAYSHPETTGNVPLIRLTSHAARSLATVYSNGQADLVLHESLQR